MTNLPKRITESWISKTEEPSTLEAAWLDLSDRGALLLASARSPEEMWDTGRFRSLERRWSLLNAKLKEINPARSYGDWGDAIC